ncbi:PIG-L family deacetylase [Rhodococcus sp. BP-149]|nr:PIG-L family deacetylase [Rhodococcus sp. BP-332]MBY6685469.1 PIG-L family deacetylase [Rhodococcus sp. BP-288]MBY6694966.1 PIG-L family deacetylase [Rhodococcus sp. BP-188]MBY6696829.1 PIG-L family deacetylase [Rhodococcus sp. BP-285]MBY6703485.1 PIG-L family deacetylase [Rhodococcus sp. BP-283]MBY6710561.1 PIG-L family deacetylase [Rhodococcus sp. BP-160]MBY6714827.1 PIG-L family deacetylase [Rhodococcus sp. BP-110]MBY6721043.1 PIG-L family deacetylase [Rhodococcus sp. BP-142]MBY672473
MVSVDRFAERPVAQRGTPESVWRENGPTYPDLVHDGLAHLVLVAPHPDDEVLGLGGWASMLAASGVPVTVVAVTDGGASHTPTPARSRADLEAVRRAESASALVDLGIVDIRRLSLPDGQVAEHERALVDALVDVLDTVGRGTTVWCATTLRGDGHPDHEAVGRASAAAASRNGCTLVEYPVWMWHWAEPGDEAVDWESARTITLDADAIARKEVAVSRFVSQTTRDGNEDEILPPWVLERLLRSHETVFV